MLISVIIPTHNPRPDHIRQTLEGLRHQTLPSDVWELIVVDNASVPPVSGLVDLSWHPKAKVIREETLGLTQARLAGMSASSGDIIVLVDDDNVLAADFLRQTIAIASDHPRLGTWSGNVFLQFAADATPPPPEWQAFLTVRQVSEDSITTDRHHHESTPWGAGLCIRKEVAKAYQAETEKNPLRRQLDLKGRTLVYGGDTDIAFVGCAHGFSKGVLSRLSLTHLIPAERCTDAYLHRAAEGQGYSAVMHEYILTGSFPPYFGDPIWRAQSWVKRLFLPKNQRIIDHLKARGTARAVRDIRMLMKSS